MGRIHLFEWEDLSWFPSNLRNYCTDFLQFLSNKSGMFNTIVPKIEEILCKTNQHQIIDLGSGGSGGLLSINRVLKNKIPNLKITFTDFYPNLPAFEANVKSDSNLSFESQAIDARDVPTHLKGLRTQFLSFHHFRPTDARKILQNAVDNDAPIAIFEGQERSFPSILAMLLSPLSVLFTTPFIKPFRLGRIFFTYLLPFVPFVVLWDGVISSLRTYSTKEMEALVKELNHGSTYHWEIGKIKSGPAKILYLIGYKKTIN